MILLAQAPKCAEKLNLQKKVRRAKNQISRGESEEQPRGATLGREVRKGRSASLVNHNRAEALCHESIIVFCTSG